MNLRRHLVSAAAVAALVTLGACGSSDSGDGDTATDSESTAAASTTTSAPSGAPSVDAQQMQAVQDCLDAAGIELDLPSGMPSGMPTDMPSDLPSGMPTDLPSDMASGGPFADPEVQAALKACGIEAPTAPAQP